MDHGGYYGESNVLLSMSGNSGQQGMYQDGGLRQEPGGREYAGSSGLYHERALGGDDEALSGREAGIEGDESSYHAESVHDDHECKL